MQLATMQKFGGISLIAGSIFLTIYSVCFPMLLPIQELRHDLPLVVNNSNWIWISFVALIGVILMFFGFIALYSRLYPGSGLTGFLGFILIELAYVLQAGKVTWEIFLYPIISRTQSSAVLFRDRIIQHDPLVIGFKTASSFVIFLGIILFCLALVRSREFPKLGGILLFAGAFIYGLGPFLSVYLVVIIGIFILSIGCMVLGGSLIMMSSPLKKKCFFVFE